MLKIFFLYVLKIASVFILPLINQFYVLIFLVFCNCNCLIKECNNGMYGDLCQNECGHCAETPQCHHINGTCLNGCLPGYTSEFCNQSR